MALFQQSIIKKYLQELDNNSVNTAFDKFHKHFGNTERQNNIRELKEEQYQEGFLRELFVNILGYTINPEPNYNLLTEQKNEKDSKKADGAIINQGADAPSIIAVIELKGTDTTDLSKVENQAFGYKNNQKDCKYVIISNFEKLRFYIDNAIDFEEFNLFNLTKERFQLLYLCLSKENLLNGVPQKIKEASVSQEENITKKLYSDYSTFKRTLYQNLVELNPKYDKLTLFKKTQKLLDRFLFIFFAEDRLLLPPNSIREIIKQWNQLKDLDNYTPLYDRFKKYFGYMNTGFKGKQYEIFAYNGGFFAPDEILDNIKIDDTILHDHTLRLSNYDFDTEVDVNILGHIFEHSLNEIEEIQSEIEGKELDKSKTKRKKDGVFYTPKYITKYIVENTVGALCTEKKIELEINEEEIIISKRKDKKKELIEKIDSYRNWLLKLTICDPACGSGAFLNQALDYLLIEHKKLDELKARITNSSMILSDIENSVLENNIFGVDLNDEAVEIARLSLWLKTAQKGRKLSDLSKNIKCGNSLIDDKNIAGEKAFNWQYEFSEIFAHGGFDVIIGNPPYVRVTDKLIYNFLSLNYSCASNRIDLYGIFIEKGLSILKESGKLSFITPNTFVVNLQYEKLRSLIFKFKLDQIIDFRYQVFDTASVDTVIILLQKLEVLENEINIYKFFNENEFYLNFIPFSVVLKSKFIKDGTINLNSRNSQFELISKMNRQPYKLEDFAKVRNGINPGYPESRKHLLIESPEKGLNPKKRLDGKDISRYYLNWENKWVDYDKSFNVEGGSLRDETIFNEPKILIQDIRNLSLKRRIVSVIDNDHYYNLYTLHNIQILKDNNKNYNLKSLLAILNSSLLNFYFAQNFKDIHIKPRYILQLPFPNLDISQIDKLSSLADSMLKETKCLNEKLISFQKYLASKFLVEIKSKKIENWDLLSFSEFIIEINLILKKNNIKILSKTEEFEWLEIFSNQCTILKQIRTSIYSIDKEIDQLVYQLYELAEDEIKIVDNIKES